MIDFSANPTSLAPAHGYSHVTVKGELVFLAGQTGQDATGEIVTGGLIAQVRQALSNLREALQEVGGVPGDIAYITIFVADVEQYGRHVDQITEHWLDVLGPHFPAATLVGHAQLWQAAAEIEITAIAVVPADRLRRSPGPA